MPMQSRKEEVRTIMTEPKSCKQVAVRQRGKDSGFILTLELLVLLSIFGTVVYFGFQLYQEWLVKQIDPTGGKSILVYDGGNNGVARTRSFNNNEAPLFVYRLSPPELPAAAVLGIRSDGFTTRQRVYYTDSTTCAGNFRWVLDPTLAAGAASQAASAAYAAATVGVATPWNPWDVSPISDTYNLQTIAFAAGPNNGAVPEIWKAFGTLSTNPAGTPGTGVFGPPQSEWASERYGADRCHDLTTSAELQAYAAAISVHLIQVDANPLSPSFTTGGGPPVIWTPDFWAPTRIGSTPAFGPPVSSTLPMIPPTGTEGGGTFTTTGGTPASGTEGVP